METINIHKAKTQLWRLVEKAAKGEPFVIAKAGKPMVKVVPLDTPDADQKKRLGFLVDQIKVPKAGLGREDFVVEPGLVRRGLLDNGYEELPVSSAHAVALTRLPAIHKDPFDRILVAQAQVEGIVLVTSDDTVFQYPGAIERV